MDLQAIIQKNIEKGTRHKHYDKVTNLAEMYEAFIMNEPYEDKDGKQVYPLNKYLRQFVRREDDELFEQRIKITKHYAPSICSALMKPFNKVVRSNRVVKLIDHKDDAVIKDMEEAMNKFYGEADNSGFDQFLRERYFPLVFTDPNAWVWVAFEKFDANKEKPYTFPVEYSSKAVINYSVDHDYTEWVLVKLSYSYIAKNDAEKTSDRYIIFGEDVAYEYKLIPDDIKESETFVKPDDTLWITEKDKKKFVVYNYEHKSGRVPLMRVGYRRDLSTKSETFVNPFHYEALPTLQELVKVTSELQLSITLHAFPKQVIYTEECDAKGCNGGLMMDGKTECQVCNGTGKKFHTTAADILRIPLPKSKNMDQVIDANKLSAYIDFPGGVLEFLDEYVDKLKKEIVRMVFNSETILQTQYAKTATEADIDVDSIYDTLHPFAEKYSELWMFFGKLTALYRSHKDVTIYHKFNSDYKFKSLKQLLEELKSASDSNAPSYIRESINNDITDIMYADDPAELSKLKIKNKHFPFPGKTDIEIQNIILNNLATRHHQVLYANFDNIFDQIEIEHKDFYNLAYVKQKDIVKKIVDAIIEELTPTTASFNLNNPTDV
ncbi:hypothetical protein C7S20_19420 [Christiangramia fulva]|uniref:Phage portal protein n=1 Tax=Christiangramia fulva TaxID=2126553 RepID=A0A2R3ZAE6_9FLAO|nr:hypothetical protein [Christiangramia fulva]AVR47246.1 hypothetical protein C7S20_19420 [Christiangramia fulva]